MTRRKSQPKRRGKWSKRLRRVWKRLGGNWSNLRRSFKRYFRAVLSFLAFWRRRNARYLFQGAPAALALFGVLGLSIAWVLASPAELMLAYQKFADEKLQAKDFAAARIAYERLAMIDGRPEFRYGLAVATDGTGQRERAFALMDSLASRNGPGYGPAHYWLAVALLAQPTSRSMPLVERHLQQAIRLQSQAEQAHAMLGALYLQAKRLDEAERHLLIASDTQPNVALMLAELYQHRGQKQKARSWAEKSARHYQAQVQADPANAMARISWSEAHLFLGEPDRAVAILEEGFSATRADGYRHWIARAYLAWVDSIKGTSAEDQEKRLSLIDRGLRANPNDQGLLQRLVLTSRTDGSDSEKTRVFLQGLLAEGKCSATLNLLLGMQALDQGKSEVAQSYLEKAYQLDPNLPTVANNLAWMLAFSEPPQLPRALQMVNSVLEREPRNLHVRETRGQIYVKMGRWADALADLQSALSAFPEAPNLHKAMAESYRMLGNREMAERHQKLADARKP